ncbi:MAG: glycosyltransferase [Eubacteriales bacterium]
MLPNEQVIELCKQAHVGLLPTFADTYGYATLEMQACGLPVVTTDVRALTEINNETCGWVVHLTKNQYGEACYSTDVSRNNMKHELQCGLETTFKEIFENKEMIEVKAQESLVRLELNHSESAYSEKMEVIYRNAIDG